MNTEQIEKLIATLEGIGASINSLREEIKDGIPVFTKEHDSFGVDINNAVDVSADVSVEKTLYVSNADL